MGALSQKDPVSDVETYYREIQAVRAENSGFRSIDNGMTPGVTITPTNAPMDDAFWKQYDNRVWESNFEGVEDSPVDTFSIEDYVDF